MYNNLACEFFWTLCAIKTLIKANEFSKLYAHFSRTTDKYNLIHSLILFLSQKLKKKEPKQQSLKTSTFGVSRPFYNKPMVI